jgi:hypothetical protein
LTLFLYGYGARSYKETRVIEQRLKNEARIKWNNYQCPEGMEKRYNAVLG